ncbi:MAG TPA: glycerate kinase, partial [Cytophagales bacterium]|nr:glycerate kinase [Cytophagales bacterium]
GAAGGITATFHHLLGAQLESGAQFVMDRLGVPKMISQMDYVITAEGSLDAQSLAGKAPGLLAQMAQAQQVPTFALVGQVKDREEISKRFDVVFPINPEWKNAEYAYQEVESHLSWAAEQVGRMLKLMRRETVL